MKKLLVIMLMAMMLCIPAYAQITPLPIAVKVTSIPSTQVPVKITNLNTGDISQGMTNIYGEYIEDWANMPNKYAVGNQFKIEIWGNVQTFTYTGSPPDIFYFTVAVPCSITGSVGYGGTFRQLDASCNVEITGPPSCGSCSGGGSCNCGGGGGGCYCEPCDTCETCQTCENPTCPTCDTCQTCETCQEPICPEVTFAVIITAIIAAIGGGGVALRFSRNGVQHIHPGVSGYHSIYTVHRDAKLKHPKGCWDAKDGYKKGTDGKYYFEGCPSGQHK